MGAIALGLISGGVALVTAAFLAWLVLRNDEGNETVREIADLIREGSAAFLRREYTILAIFVVAIFVVLLLFIDLNVLDESKITEINSVGRVEQQGPWTALSYLAGAVGSALAGFIGMNIAVRGNSRTATAAQRGLNPALRIAFNSGAVMGLTVVGIGLIGVTGALVVIPEPKRGRRICLRRVVHRPVRKGGWRNLHEGCRRRRRPRRKN